MSHAIEVVTVTPSPAIDWTLTIPDFEVGKVNRVQRDWQNPGGKGLNVAGALRAFGHRVVASGFLGSENAAVFEEFLERTGIVDGFLRVPGSTRIGIKVADPSRMQTTDVNFRGAAARPGDDQALRERLVEMAGPACPWFVLAGSLPPGIELTFYRDLATTLKARGCPIAVDASGEALRHALDAAPHVVKPNVHELEALVGEALPGREAILAAARDMIRRGVELVVVSMGGEGALFVRDDEVAFARPPAVTVHSTVGAGDAMVAGIVAGHLGGLDLPEIARLASAFSVHAISVEGRGTTTREAVHALLNAIVVE